MSDFQPRTVARPHPLVLDAVRDTISRDRVRLQVIDEIQMNPGMSLDEMIRLVDRLALDQMRGERLNG